MTTLAFTVDAAQRAELTSLERLARECGLEVDFPAEFVRSYALLRVARVGGEPVGFLLAWRAADELHLTDLGVTAPVRRNGIARALVRDLLAEGQHSGARVVFLEVRASNAPALALYAALGFEQLDVRRRYYSDTGEDAVVMQRLLSAT